jgi:hypothetical protein
MGGDEGEGSTGQARNGQIGARVMWKVDDGVVRGRQRDRVENVDSGSGVRDWLSKSAGINISQNTTHDNHGPCTAEDRSSDRHTEGHPFDCDARTE